MGKEVKRKIQRLLFALAFLIPGQAWAEEVLLEDGVERPFEKSEAIEALKADLFEQGGQEALDSLPANADKILPEIIWWGYKIVKMEDGGGTATFIQRFDATSTISALRSYIASLKKSNCSYINPSAPSFSVFPKRVDFRVSLDGKQRACGEYPWGGGWATNVGSISGEAGGSLTFDVVPSAEVPDFAGKIQFNTPDVQVDVKVGDFLGINSSSVAGQLLENIINTVGNPFGAALNPMVGVPAWAIKNEIDKGMRLARGAASDAAVYVEKLRGRVDPTAYNRMLATSQTVVWGTLPQWVMNEDETRFIGDPTSLEIQVVFNAPAPPFGQVYDFAAGGEQTLRQLRSYSAETKTHQVVKGENWSQIAKKEYGSSFLASALRASQVGGFAQERLAIGQEIDIPPLWKVTAIKDHYVVRPGDTFTSICKRRNGTEIKSCIRLLGKLNPHILPRQLKALSVIRVASTEIEVSEVSQPAEN